MRAVGDEERVAFRRHLGAGVAPVQGLRGLPGAAREIRQPQAGQRIAAGRGHRLQPVPERPADAAGNTACHRQPYGDGQRAAGRHHHRVRLEDHAARRGGTRHRPSADRPDGNDPAARQDHRTAAGGGRMDGLHSAFRASEIGRPGQRQEPVADHDPRRRDQPGPDQDGGVLPRHDLRQAGLAASLAHPRRNLRGGAGRSGQRTVPPSLRRALGRRHHLIVGRPELPHRQQGREHRPHQPEIREQPRADVLHPHF
ncbi:Uncharacterised protein [Pseudomonas putida]|nr:transposase for transposon Tn21 [Proteus mirabilis WGLW6]CAB5628486.1 Uncharacterised protein [Pseudomonas putida]CAB5628927.1 Uncharacterised protein [Pseudomonas putida]